MQDGAAQYVFFQDEWTVVHIENSYETGNLLVWSMIDRTQFSAAGNFMGSTSAFYVNLYAGKNTTEAPFYPFNKFIISYRIHNDPYYGCMQYTQFSTHITAYVMVSWDEDKQEWTNEHCTLFSFQIPTVIYICRVYGVFAVLSEQCWTSLQCAGVPGCGPGM